MDDKRTGHIEGIDGLRAVAVLAVVAFHLNPALAPGGFRGVDVFFAISGFVVTGALMGRQAANVFDLAAGFYAARVRRILPALIVCLLTTALVTTLLTPPSWLATQTRNVMVAAFLGFSNLVLMLGGGYFEPSAAYDPFLQTWSLGVEEQFYLIFPLLLIPFLIDRRRLGLMLLAGLALASLAAWFVLHQIDDRWAFYSFVSRFWEIGAGVLLRLTLSQWQPWLKRIGRWKATLLACLAWGSLGLILSLAAEASGVMEAGAVAGALAVIALVTARPNDWPGRLAARSLPQAIGRLSYSLYLWHWPTFVLFRWTVGLDGPVHCGLALLTAFVLAILSYVWVEQPSRRAVLPAFASSRLIVASGVAIALCGAAFAAAIDHARPELSLSVTRDTAVWQADERTPVILPNARCALSQTRERTGGGVIIAISRTGCPRPAASRTVFVMGDSHALSYLPMLRAHSAATGDQIRLFFKESCAFLPLYDEEASALDCWSFHQSMLDHIARTTGPGDVLFMPSLRLERISDQNGPALEDIVDPSQAALARANALREAQEALRPLSALDIHLVFEAPKPIFPAAAFRCSDSFNRNNPVCRPGLTISVVEMARRRAPVLASMAMLSRDPQISVWDPFPELCPNDPCSAFRNGRPLFFDGDHLSGYGSVFLAQSFERYLDHLLSKGVENGQRSR